MIWVLPKIMSPLLVMDCFTAPFKVPKQDPNLGSAHKWEIGIVAHMRRAISGLGFRGFGGSGFRGLEYVIVSYRQQYHLDNGNSWDGHKVYLW